MNNNVNQENNNTNVNDMNNINTSKDNSNNKKSKNNKKIIFIIIGVVVTVLVLLGCLSLYISSITYTVDDDYSNSTEDIPTMSNQNTNKNKKECNISSITISGNSEAEKALKKLTGWTIEGYDYSSDGNKTSNELDTYFKVSTALYNLGYFEEKNYDSISDCTLSKTVLDNKIFDLFKNTEYNPEEFSGNNALPYVFKYDKKNKIYSIDNIGGGTGSEGEYIQKVYDETKSDNKLTFKTKVLYGTHDLDELSNLDFDNNFKNITSNIPDDVTYENVIDKYDSYANIYQWTFVKNNNEEYVFDNIRRIK